MKLAEKLQREAGLLEFLDGVKSMMPVSLMALVRDRGQPFTSAALPANVRRGLQNQCFCNAFNLMTRRDDLIYVEGYAHWIIPTLHAWCVTEKGVVIDPTWDDPEDCAYYGIPLRGDFVARTVIRNKVYGVLADPATAHRMFKTAPARYRAAV